MQEEKGRGFREKESRQYRNLKRRESKTEEEEEECQERRKDLEDFNQGSSLPYW